MAKQTAVAPAGFWQGFARTEAYKRNQGRITRQVTLAAMWIVVVLAWFRISGIMRAKDMPEGWSDTSWWAISIGLPFAGLLLGAWACYRVVNYHKFADFLIAVEAEMNKVSWPSRTELTRSSIVVIFVMFAMAALLFSFDLLWKFAFQWLGIILG